MTIASIDIGTNTILMVIAEFNSATGQVKTLLNEHTIPRIGKGLIPGKPISEDRAEKLIQIMEEYKRKADNLNCKKIIATATNAFRIASNSDELTKTIKNRTGIDVKIVSGEEESYLSYLGATIGSDKNRNVLVIDIGGGSTEIIAGKGENIFFKKSFQIGVVSATEKYLLNSPPLNLEISNFEHELGNVFLYNSELTAQLLQTNFKADKVIAIAGTPTTLACIKQNLGLYNEDSIEGSSLTLNEIKQISLELSHLSSSAIMEKYKAVVAGREDVLLAGAYILYHLMEVLKIPEVIVSTKGIRYGAIITELTGISFRSGI